MSSRTSIVAAAVLITAAGLPQSAQATAGWGKPVLVENFNGSSVDTGKWMIYHSPQAETNPRTGRAATVSNGVLRLKGGRYGGKDLSGGIATKRAQKYGRWEVRFKAEAGNGYTPVALLWPTRQGEGDDYAEVDFAEIVDPKRQGGGIFIHSGHDRARKTLRADFTKWHTVAVDWLPGRMTFWLDGRKVWDYRGPHVPEGRPMGLALQNDVVCEPRCRDSTTPDTVSMYVDWVKIYQLSQ
ncbi:glycoside hydrolase family 16 protein [Nonomuraea sp. NN258]|uniref:glycoside hydrolase family 16 protein n=1 Tax=Nonomuraea antri TaxID=2730852 RepID=UPI0015694FDF|nr:glycoside hydrolase family 16 protein [Nonomuraea antri]NRQ33996.1 glycoside hydrolase family 16 protein [Nonomuraea antri]